MNDMVRKPIKPSPTDVMSTWMYAVPKDGNKRPNLKIQVIGNVPRIVVKTNVPEDTRENGRILWKTDLPTFAAMLYKLEELANDESDQSRYTFEYNDDYVAGQKRDKMLNISNCVIGIDKETNRIYMAITGHERPKIQFFFGPAKNHNIKINGEDAGADVMSRIYAKGFVQWVSGLVYPLLTLKFEPDAKNVAKAPTGPPGQGGGYNNRGGGGGNYGNQPAPPSGGGFDDDPIF